MADDTDGLWHGVVYFDAGPHVSVWNAVTRESGIDRARAEASRESSRVLRVVQVRELREGEQTPPGLVLDCDGEP
jgi:hypothetical protein